MASSRLNRATSGALSFAGSTAVGSTVPIHHKLLVERQQRLMAAGSLTGPHKSLRPNYIAPSSYQPTSSKATFRAATRCLGLSEDSRGHGAPHAVRRSTVHHFPQPWKAQQRPSCGTAADVVLLVVRTMPEAARGSSM
ncbi:hypothetical protein BDU57DRAFT_561257 [Ampelomyces quisqualis]|uniref:Uncharacterized protein n=1 Tax=Ampelomyces quisqualis TaxID=50730 RepID=A0A6A5QZN4_AMPQU|nr:hypothetical protein BDU57DRAFT_561257 [Ampelomyces quisqualis]